VTKPGYPISPLAKSAAQDRTALAESLRRYGAQAANDGSSLYGYLMTRAATDVLEGGPCAHVLHGTSGGAPALRLMAGVHRLVLEGKAPDLAVYYPSAGGVFRQSGLWDVFHGTVAANVERLNALARLPVQTNEVGRSRALLGGFLLVAKETGLPLNLLEIGSSAGLNLRWDRYRYETESGSWGDSTSPVRLRGQLTGRPPLEVRPLVTARRGCDLRPLDVSSQDDRLRLLSYVWPDQPERMARLRAALDVAVAVPAQVDRSDAQDWLEGTVARQTAGVATVTFHSIMMGYLSNEGRERVRSLVMEAGDRATADAPFAWLRMESAQRGAPLAGVRLTLWPGGEDRLLATTGFHGQGVVWLGP
jgi:hypothetical protein